MGKFGQFLDTTAGGAVTGGLMDGIGSLFTIGAQKRAATTAYNRQKEFWKMQNAYNTPKAQMQRLKDAGLNPALMYGQGNTGNAQNLSGVQRADVSGPSLAHSAAQGAQISLVNAQRKNIEADTKNKNKDLDVKDATIGNIIQNTSNIYYKTQLIKVQTQGEKYNNARNKGTLMSDIKIAGETLKQLYLDNALTQETWTGLVNEQIGLGLQALTKNKLLGKQINLTNTEIDKLKTEICAINERVAIDWRNSDSSAIQADAAQVANDIKVLVSEMNIDSAQKITVMQSLTNLVTSLIGASASMAPNISYSKKF